MIKVSYARDFPPQDVPCTGYLDPCDANPMHLYKPV